MARSPRGLSVRVFNFQRARGVIVVFGFSGFDRFITKILMSAAYGFLIKNSLYETRIKIFKSFQNYRAKLLFKNIL